MSQLIGFAGEELVRTYLVKQGLTWVKSNFSCKLGEIDLIMRDKEFLVFIEVRLRASSKYGSGIESVTSGKQKKLIRAALLYLQINKLYDKQACRFDVVSLEGATSNIVWIKNAFGVN